MGTQTGIQWTNKTYNPWQGCIKVSQGCKNCYMYSEKKRYGQDPQMVVRSAPATFNAPLKWKDPALVFTCSWSDFFIEQADNWRGDAWDIIRKTPHLTYQILTKRPENIATRLPDGWGDGWSNVWLGVSVENQQYANERIPKLLQVPAAVRFLSCEPLLGPVDLTGKSVDSVWIDPEYAKLDPHLSDIVEREGWWINWVIIGGESGPKARPFYLEWASDIIQQCQAANVPVFMKQVGSKPVVDLNGYRGNGFTGKGGDMSEWPAELRVREFPKVGERCRPELD